MKASEVKTTGVLADAIMKHRPTLMISARVGDSYPEDKSWRKEEKKRLRKEIKQIEEELNNWDPDKISSKALKSLKSELVMKKARMMETSAILEDDDEGEDEE